MVLHGVWVWVWPTQGWSKINPNKLAGDCKVLGIDGVIPHAAFDAAGWLYKAGQHNRVSELQNEGLLVSVGIGRSRGLDDRPAEACAKAIIEALEVPGQLPVMLDWEGTYDRPGGKAKAALIADKVLAAHADAADRITDCPWWAPTYYLKGRKKQYTHPNAPVAEFGRLARQDRYVQAYGTALGQSLTMLAWSRDTTQYGALSRAANVPPWTIRGAFLTYKRPWQDVVTTLFAEPNQILWSYTEMTPEVRQGLRVWKTLRDRGFHSLDEFTTAERVDDLAKIPGLLGI